MDTSDYIVQLTRAFRETYSSVILLESQKKDHPASKRSYLASAPSRWIKVIGNKVYEFDGKTESVKEENAWQALDHFYESNNDWLFGYLSYDLKNQIEDLESSNHSFLTVPDLFFFVPEILIEISADGELIFIKGSSDLIPEVLPSGGSIQLEPVHMMNREEYLRKIRTAQHDIAEGDYYEINLSHALEFAMQGDALDLYERMKKAGPVPFASFIGTEDFSVCSASPERFLSRNGNTVCSQPIKGTVSRDRDHEQAKLAELLSEKNKAENLMIVDLVRNDLNRIAIPGSVTVEDLFEIQSFETVHQMVSTVKCMVESGVHSVEIIRSCFPMGSMTGAPKIAAMHAIERLENYKRGIYSGAIGYLKPGGDFDFNVVIRTAIKQGNRLIYPVGGAITSDSSAEDEWDETLVKAKALLNSLD